MGIPHCYYLFLKFILLYSYSMKRTFLSYWIFLSLLLISLQSTDIHKCCFDFDLLLSFIHLSAFGKLIYSLPPTLTFYIRESLRLLFAFRSLLLDCPISNSKYFKVNLSLFLSKPAVLPLCPMCAYLPK